MSAANRAFITVICFSGCGDPSGVERAPSFRPRVADEPDFTVELPAVEELALGGRGPPSDQLERAEVGGCRRARHRDRPPAPPPARDPLPELGRSFSRPPTHFTPRGSWHGRHPRSRRARGIRAGRGRARRAGVPRGRGSGARSELNLATCGRRLQPSGRRVPSQHRADGPRALPVVVVLRALAHRDRRRWSSRPGSCRRRARPPRRRARSRSSRPDRGAAARRAGAGSHRAAIRGRRSGSGPRVAPARPHTRAALRAGQARCRRALSTARSTCPISRLTAAVACSIPTYSRALHRARALGRGRRATATSSTSTSGSATSRRTDERIRRSRTTTR